MKRNHWNMLLSFGLALLTLGCNPIAPWPAINNAPTGVDTPGRWVWAELFTDDIGRAGDFYGKVFAWQLEDYSQGENRYLLARADGRPVAGIVHHVKSEDKERAGQWLRLMSVADVAGAAASVAGSGGEVVLGPRQLDGRGEVAVLADPEGALFGVIHSDSGDPPDLFPPVNTWLWNELWAMDVKRMSAFYRDIGGYSLDAPPRDKAIGDDRPEVYLSASGYPRAGIVEQRREDLPSAWLPYLRVKNLDATLHQVVQEGGAVVVGPSPKIRGGRIAVFTDPLGAALGIAEWPDDDAGKRSEP